MKQSELDQLLRKLTIANGERWAQMSVKPGEVRTLDAIVARLTSDFAKSRYQAVEAMTHVPWPVIAVIHEREASQSWMANLAQGDRWDRVSTHVPAGEGPYPSWMAAAVHALTADDHLSQWKDWSIGGALAAEEKFNGIGYVLHGRPSAYIWSKTDRYAHGKYVGDGQWDGDFVDPQPGTAALHARMMVADSSISTTYGWPMPKDAGPAPTPRVVVRSTISVQEALNTLKVADPPLLVDGNLGPKTKAAIRAFQRSADILDDGKWGPVTDKALTAALSPKPLADLADTLDPARKTT